MKSLTANFVLPNIEVCMWRFADAFTRATYAIRRVGPSVFSPFAMLCRGITRQRLLQYEAPAVPAVSQMSTTVDVVMMTGMAFGWIGGDIRVGVGRQERKQLVFAFDGRALRTSEAAPCVQRRANANGGRSSPTEKYCQLDGGAPTVRTVSVPRSRRPSAPPRRQVCKPRPAWPREVCPALACRQLHQHVRQGSVGPEPRNQTIKTVSAGEHIFRRRSRIIVTADAAI